MPKGGARPGAGRKPLAEKYAGPISKAERKIADRLPAVVDLMLELAQGVTVQETTSQGEVKIYTRPPDRQACEYLLNRIMGKPLERQEVTGADGGSLSIEVVAVDYRNAITALAPDGSITAAAAEAGSMGDCETPG